MAILSYTLSTLIAAVRSRASESPDDEGQIRNDATILLLNEAQNYVCEITECITKTASDTSVASQAAYTLPTDWSKTRWVRYTSGSTSRLLSPLTEDDYWGQSSIVENSIPTGYFIQNDGNLYLHQTPSASGDTFTHNYVALPDAMTSDSDQPFNGIGKLTGYCAIIVSIVVAMFLEKEDNRSGVLDVFEPAILKRKAMIGSSTKPSSAQFQRRDHQQHHIGRPYIMGRV